MSCSDRIRKTAEGNVTAPWFADAHNFTFCGNRKISEKIFNTAHYWFLTFRVTRATASKLSEASESALARPSHSSSPNPASFFRNHISRLKYHASTAEAHASSAKNQHSFSAPHASFLKNHAWCAKNHAWCFIPHTWFLAPHVWFVTDHVWFVTDHVWFVADHVWFVADHVWFVADHAWFVMDHAWYFTGLASKEATQHSQKHAYMAVLTGFYSDREGTYSFFNLRDGALAKVVSDFSRPNRREEKPVTLRKKTLRVKFEADSACRAAPTKVVNYVAQATFAAFPAWRHRSVTKSL